MKKLISILTAAVAAMAACRIPANAVKNGPGFCMADCVQKAKEVESKKGQVTYNTPIYLGSTVSRYWITFHNGRVVMYHDDRSWYGDIELESDGLFVLGYTE